MRRWVGLKGLMQIFPRECEDQFVFSFPFVFFFFFFDAGRPYSTKYWPQQCAEYFIDCLGKNLLQLDLRLCRLFVIASTHFLLYVTSIISHFHSMGVGGWWIVSAVCLFFSYVSFNNFVFLLFLHGLSVILGKVCEYIQTFNLFWCSLRKRNQRKVNSDIVVQLHKAFDLWPLRLCIDPLAVPSTVFRESRNTCGLIFFPSPQRASSYTTTKSTGLFSSPSSVTWMKPCNILHFLLWGPFFFSWKFSQ